jgi:hypothetical protein
MNKIFCLILAAVLAAPAYAAYYTPDQIKALQDKLAAVKEPSRKANLEARIAVLSMDNPTFETVLKTTETIYAKYNRPKREGHVRVCGFAIWPYAKFAPDAYKLAVSDKLHHVAWKLVVRFQSQLGFSDQTAFDILANDILEHRVAQPGAVKQIVARMLVIAPNCDSAKVKTTLTKLNRLLSPRLLEDKAKWEPAVAMIRTALETY